MHTFPQPGGRHPTTGTAIPFVRANAFAPFIEFLREVGCPVERCLDEARIPQAMLDNPEALVPLASGYRFLELAALREGIDDVGVIVGQRLSAFDLGSYGATLEKASTVHEYLQLGSSLMSVHSTATTISLRHEHGRLRVCQAHRGPAGPGRCIGDLFTLVITLNMLRRFIGPTWCPVELRLMKGAESMLGGREVFGDTRIITGQPYTSFTIATPVLQRRISAPSRLVARRPICPGAAFANIPVDFKGSVEQLIVALMPDGGPSIRVAAEVAGLTPRTLQRRLAEAGASYSDLVASARLRLAKQCLAESSMSITEIASSLGYREASNFARGFRGRTGLSPTAYRAMYKHA
ncbi:MAG: helix-turn-helix domain-containing protein [Halieaceae bacterium]|jgi:AraC-like DNA-binding protein|nr:helix-turn-helix domain-containing protein [Halieaceae bacterium]